MEDRIHIPYIYGTDEFFSERDITSDTAKWIWIVKQDLEMTESNQVPISTVDNGKLKPVPLTSKN